MRRRGSRSEHPHVPLMYENAARLTSDRDWYIKIHPVPRYDKEDLGNVPLLSPDMFYFTIEEYQPVVYLTIRQEEKGHKQQISGS